MQKVLATQLERKMLSDGAKQVSSPLGPASQQQGVYNALEGLDPALTVGKSTSMSCVSSLTFRHQPCDGFSS